MPNFVLSMVNKKLIIGFNEVVKERLEILIEEQIDNLLDNIEEESEAELSNSFN